MTRRAFLGAAALAGSTRARIQEREFRCAVIDLGGDCVLRESLEGFAGALPGAMKVSANQELTHRQECLFYAADQELTHRQECLFYAADQELTHRQECLFYVLPGAGAISDDLGLRLARLVHRGGWLLFESAAGFAGEAAFRVQRETLVSRFGLTIERPLHLWESGASIVPYVDYAWPATVKIRDYSRVVPVLCETSEVIGTIAGQRVGVRRQVGRGVFVFLGSPIGPALAAGDRDAHRWLNRMALATRAASY